MLCAFYSHMGGRSRNEDYVEVWKAGDSVCAVVADGLGGHGRGDEASQAAVRSIRGNWKGEVSEKCWTELIQSAHQAVRALQTERERMQTTIVGIMIKERYVVWAHVGDSRLYHFVDGKIVFQTEDDSVSALAVHMGEITQDQIRFHETRNSLLKTLGQRGDEVNARTHAETLKSGKHAFLLCTDGFWEYVTEPEMELDLQSSTSPEQWLGKMRTRLQKKAPYNHDNNTATTIWV